ncbi:hypothetical protein DENIS_0292 [Desulfonema ishimotonii]|uniref:DUF4114 domain-containing protein n=2 Tax=Desulfonema ishimotonii TaxID=45657 RepID=A0A401FQW8_9BACT|nr:hypothetical protein DENIS_0292 [Desulfonema ishimotonii]
MAGVIIEGFPGDSKVTTDKDGNYSAPVTKGWFGEVTLTKDDKIVGTAEFEPVIDDTERNISVTLVPKVNLPIRVVDEQGEPVSGVYLRLHSDQTEDGSGSADSTVGPTGPEGEFIASIPEGWTGTVTLTKDNETLLSQEAVESVTENTTWNFTVPPPTPGDDATPTPGDDATPTPGDDATPTPGDDATPTPGDDATPTPGDDATPTPDNDMITISGRIVDENNEPAPGVVIKVVGDDGVSEEIVSNSDGIYTVTVRKGWTGTLAPSKGNLLFFPLAHHYKDLTESVAEDADFIISRIVVEDIGVFTAGISGEVKMGFLFDGGGYKCELGIFSLDGMEAFERGSDAFIEEAIRRVTDNDRGYIVIRDARQGARYSDKLGTSSEGNFNSGPYKGLTSLPMAPGEKFATVMIPNGTFEEVSRHLQSAGPNTIRQELYPLFSIAVPNHPTLRYGQVAVVKGINAFDETCEDAGYAVVYEDTLMGNNDGDYNDVILYVKGAEVYAPTFDGLMMAGLMPPEKDWRDTDRIGIMDHIYVCPAPDTLWMRVSLEGAAADILVYGPDGSFVGKDGGDMPGATFEWTFDRQQVITLPELEDGAYRIVLRAIGDGGLCRLEVRGGKGEEVFSSEKKFTIDPHQVLKSEIDVPVFVGEDTIVFELPHVPVGPDGRELRFDFNGDGVFDKKDAERLDGMWGKKEGDETYDSFFDLNEDGEIDFYDIIFIANRLYSSVW